MIPKLKTTLIAAALATWGIYHFFYEYAHNTQGLVINHIFKLNVGQANTFYFVMGCLSCLLLAAFAVSAYLIYKQEQ